MATTSKAASKTASKTSTAKKTTASKTTASKTTATKAAASKKPSTATRISASAAKGSAPAKPRVTRRTVGSAPTPEERYRMTQEAAYFIAERNGFAGGDMDYWIEAEAQISALLARK